MTAAMDIILEVKNLSIGFYVDGRVITAVDDISFQVYRGETLAILGESGSGKSVSAATIMDLVERPPGEIISGEILFQGHNLFAMSRRERLQINGKRIAIIFQDPMVHLNPVYSVGWQIAETFRAHNAVPKGGAWREAVRLMERVGISKAGERAHQYPHEFSGGQRQRIMIAMALALRPELLIADEPTTALDVTIQAQILELLRELQKEMGMSVILITHDLNVAASVADRLVVMYGGKVVETGDVRAVFDNPQHSYTRKLLSAAIGTQVSELSRPRRQIGGDPLLSVRDLSKTYVLPSRGLIPKWRQIDAVKGVSFDIRVGETLGLVGESGSGKSTVARMLLRLNGPSAGSAHYAGQDIFGMNERELLAYRRNVQMIFQDPYASLNPRMSVEKIIAEPWVIHRDLLPRSGWARRVEALLDMVGLDPGLRLRYPHQFSGGQRQRIAIARALACEPKIIICDEAVSALDVSIQAQIMALLAALRDKLGLSFMFITHDLPLARSFADTIIVMKDGHIVEAGPADQVFSAPAHIYTKTLLSSIPTPKWTGEDGAAVAPQHA
jgi:peptide/nickel transport system ATP-binding protein